MISLLRQYLLLILAMTLLVVPLAGCQSSDSADGMNHQFEMASLKDMPAMVHQAPVRVQEAYRFAVANPDILQQIPCYCGCGRMGHTSDYACYVAGQAEDGALIFEAHALGCSICVDITQDTMRMLDEGKGVDEILAYVDSTYSRFGPPTQADVSALPSE